MKVQTFRRIQREDFPDADEWFFDVADVMNKQFEQTTNPLRKNLNFTDNFNAQIIEDLRVDNDTEFEITTQSVKGPATGVFIMETNFKEFHFPPLWSVLSEDKISVRIRWISQPSESPTVSLLIIGA